jgi:uncharacterized protein YegP (UPF0339 family)
MSLPAFRVEIYQAKDGWRWHIRAANNRIVAESGEAYSSRVAVTRGYERVKQAFEMREVQTVWVISKEESRRIFGKPKRG